ncbi:MAG: alpha/beta fold hydrolase [Gemmatimonadaceae bacterium]|nr:alpha/beta fold hydrolase [Gemmatimonadaceae bacterium]NUQ94574.1 alpha/beta fold hydrolase [Gemmatimonadaceae bacterium]NUR20230.1 alpha/beta fold hydrolase [Gemmatimonadaceae bacterium]NUS97739.1 alpha/beta fold hydrolase [Gemmatimonadaceae bacterium]
MKRDDFIAFRRSLGPTPRLTHRTVHARGIDFAVWSSPEVPGATPLLCVNGGLLYDHSLLWPALSPLAATRQLWFYDQRGRGRTPAPPGARSATIEHDAGDVGALRRALGIARWDLLGHSWGGGIALLGAERDQDGTRAVVGVCPVGATSGWMRALDDAALARLGPVERAALERHPPASLTSDDPNVQSAHARALYPAWFADPTLAGLFSPPRATSVTGAAVAARLRREGYDWRSLLSALRTPVLVIGAERDLLPLKAARELADTLPSAHLVVVPGSGHMPFWEAPERFFAVVDSFLSAPSSDWVPP